MDDSFEDSENDYWQALSCPGEEDVENESLLEEIGNDFGDLNVPEEIVDDRQGNL